MIGTKIVNRMRSVGLGAALLLVSHASAALADSGSSPDAGLPDDECSAPALGFAVGPELHVNYDVSTTRVDGHRISLHPNAKPPKDAFVPFEGHPDWGRVAIAVIVSAPKDGPEYLPILNASSEDARLTVPALADYFAIYLEKSAPPGSEFADYLFHTSQGVAAGYHLVHTIVEYDWWTGEPTNVLTVQDIDEPIADDFQQGVVPNDVNL